MRNSPYDDTSAMAEMRQMDFNHSELKNHDEPEIYRKTITEEQIRNVKQNGIQRTQ